MVKPAGPAMVSVNVKLFGILRRHVPDYDHEKGVVLTLKDGSSIRDVVGVLGLPEKEAGLFLVKGRPKRREDTVCDGDEIAVFVMMAGG